MMNVTYAHTWVKPKSKKFAVPIIMPYFSVSPAI